MRILSFWFVTYFIVKVASFVGHLFEGEWPFCYVGGCYSLVLCEECFVGLVAISVIGTPFFGLIPTVILWEGSLLGLLHVAITFFHFGTYIFVVDFFFHFSPWLFNFFLNNFKICFCVKDFFFHFICNGLFGLLWPTTYFLLKDSVFDLPPLSVDIPLLTITNNGSHN